MDQFLDRCITIALAKRAYRRQADGIDFDVATLNFLDTRFDFPPIDFAMEGLPSDVPTWGAGFKSALRTYYNRSLFALANREIDARLDEVYRNLPPPALSRFGEVLSRTDEVI